MVVFLEFLSQHWIYSLVLVMMLGALAYIEIFHQASDEAIEVSALVQLINRADPLLIDIRPAQSYAMGHIEGSISIPKQDFQEKIEGYRKKLKKRPLIVICNLGRSALKIHEQLLKMDFNSRYLLGGLEAWQKQGMPIVNHKLGGKND